MRSSQFAVTVLRVHSRGAGDAHPLDASRQDGGNPAAYGAKARLVGSLARNKRRDAKEHPGHVADCIHWPGITVKGESNAPRPQASIRIPTPLLFHYFPFDR